MNEVTNFKTKIEAGERVDIIVVTDTNAAPLTVTDNLFLVFLQL